tara:strand:+ start:308 stop:772 length:465 start_codon:yes stop_codon:yes gene_type:complete
MAINFGEGFNILNRDPIDSRTAVKTIAERNALDYFTLFEGLITYVSESQKTFVLTATGSDVGVGQIWKEVGGDLQSVLESGDSASLGFSASIANVEEVSFIGSSAIPIKLKKHASHDYLTISGSGIVIQETTTTPTVVTGALIYSQSNFYAGIG